MFTERIHIDPEICGGKPFVKGTRIPVYMVLELVEAGIPFDQITRDYYPSLTQDDIRSCIQYATFLVQEEVILAEAFAH